MASSRLTVIAVLLTLSTLPVCAQDQTPTASPPTINTDRPAFTDASTVVPKGSFQLENGFLETTASGQATYDFPESDVRIGLLDKTELRFTVPDDYQGFTAGFGDLGIGVKQQLGPVLGFDVSVVAEMTLPTGAKAISSHGYDPYLQVPWSRKLSTNWTTAGMFSVYWPTQGTSRNTTGQVTYLFDRQLTNLCDAFIEYAGNFPERGGPQHILHVGTSYRLTPRQQLDFHAGWGLSSAAPDYFIGVGYSLLLFEASAKPKP